MNKKLEWADVHGDAAPLTDAVRMVDDATAPFRTAEGELVLRLKRVAEGASLADTNISSSDLSGAICEGVVFRGAQLDGGIAIESFFDGANFEGASLRNVDFSRSSLRGCKFKGAQLSGADFENTDLTGADLTGVDLSDAHFPGAILDDVRPSPSTLRSLKSECSAERIPSDRVDSGMPADVVANGIEREEVCIGNSCSPAHGWRRTEPV